MQVHGLQDSKVTFVRKRRFSSTVDGVPGEWDLELSVCGTPHPLSGMILNLSDIDRMMDTAIAETSSSRGASKIVNVTDWLADLKNKISAEIKKLTLSSESASSDASFSSIAIDDGDHRYFKN